MNNNKNEKKMEEEDLPDREQQQDTTVPAAANEAITNTTTTKDYTVRKTSSSKDTSCCGIEFAEEIDDDGVNLLIESVDEKGFLFGGGGKQQQQQQQPTTTTGLKVGQKVTRIRVDNEHDIYCINHKKSSADDLVEAMRDAPIGSNITITVEQQETSSSDDDENNNEITTSTGRNKDDTNNFYSMHVGGVVEDDFVQQQPDDVNAAGDDGGGDADQQPQEPSQPSQPQKHQSIMDAARSEALRPFVIISTSYLLFTVTDGAIRMIVLLHAYNKNFSALEVAIMFTLYELAGVFTNLAAGFLGAKWGIKVTLISGLLLQLFSYGLLFGWQDDWDKTTAIVYVTIAQMFAGIAKDLTKLGGKTVTKLVTPSDKETKLFKLVSLLTGWKNSLKGVGYFLGSALLQVSYFCALGVMMGLVVLAIPWAVVGLDRNLGTAKKENATWKQVFTWENSNLTILSCARLFLFASRDFWFEVPLPFFLRSPSCDGLGTTTCEIDNMETYESEDCTNGAICGLDSGVCENINVGGGCGGLGLDRVVVGAFLGGYIILYGQVQSWTPQLVTGPLKQTPPNKLTEVFWGLINCIPTLVATIVVQFGPSFQNGNQPAMTVWLVVIIVCFAIIFAINSSIHSFLVVKYASHDKVAVSVGLYYMSNACGRLLGTIGSGLLYTYVGDTINEYSGSYAVAGLAACFLAGTLSSLVAAIITCFINDQDKHGLKCGSCTMYPGTDNDDDDGDGDDIVDEGALEAGSTMKESAATGVATTAMITTNKTEDVSSSPTEKEGRGGSAATDVISKDPAREAAAASLTLIDLDYLYDEHHPTVTSPLSSPGETEELPTTNEDGDLLVAAKEEESKVQEQAILIDRGEGGIEQQLTTNDGDVPPRNLFNFWGSRRGAVSSASSLSSMPILNETLINEMSDGSGLNSNPELEDDAAARNALENSEVKVVVGDAIKNLQFDSSRSGGVSSASSLSSVPILNETLINKMSDGSGLNSNQEMGDDAVARNALENSGVQVVVEDAIQNLQFDSSRSDALSSASSQSSITILNEHLISAMSDASEKSINSEREADVIATDALVSSEVNVLVEDAMNDIASPMSAVEDDDYDTSPIRQYEYYEC